MNDRYGKFLSYQTKMQYLLIPGNKIKLHNGHIIQSRRYSPQLLVPLSSYKYDIKN